MFQNAIIWICVTFFFIALACFVVLRIFHDVRSYREICKKTPYKLKKEVSQDLLGILFELIETERLCDDKPQYAEDSNEISWSLSNKISWHFVLQSIERHFAEFVQETIKEEPNTGFFKRVLYVFFEGVSLIIHIRVSEDLYENHYRICILEDQA